MTPAKAAAHDPRVDAYLDALPVDQRDALQHLRQQVADLVPDAAETISYGMPAFKLDGRYFVGFAAAKRHCSFYTGRAPIQAHADQLTDYRLWKGTVNFKPDRPLPDELVTKLVRSRLAEHHAR